MSYATFLPTLLSSGSTEKHINEFSKQHIWPAFFKKNEQTYTIVHVFNRVRFVAFRSQGDPNNNKN